MAREIIQHVIFALSVRITIVMVTEAGGVSLTVVRVIQDTLGSRLHRSDCLLVNNQCQEMYSNLLCFTNAKCTFIVPIKIYL